MFGKAAVTILHRLGGISSRPLPWFCLAGASSRIYLRWCLADVRERIDRPVVSLGNGAFALVESVGRLVIPAFTRSVFNDRVVKHCDGFWTGEHTISRQETCDMFQDLCVQGLLVAQTSLMTSIFSSLRPMVESFRDLVPRCTPTLQESSCVATHLSYAKTTQ
jgi:hypothetical protein